ncbi:MAG: Thioredoxin reductase [candidate division Zixibacteria bacterium RBG-1]|nr:MAG: Thioredoxin reductase [candidate division Zixibacteria bacterium RBG-1]OGC84082.1 MAG: thioredoxin-disulfide reductase [candidate division Zixibacteria bacterium RBG_19FT_COMBO_42_43]
MSGVYEVIIVGTGPAGLTVALYAARANLKPLVFEGIQPGGQLTITTEVENYPGFPEGILGPELMNKFRAQAQRFGAICLNETVSKADFSVKPFKIMADGKTYLGETVIIATGASAKSLGLASEKKLMGYGVSSCAVCDGFFFKDKDLIVVGGGDSAMEESTFLTKFARKVSVVHRRDKLRASKIMQEKAFKNPKIDFIWNSEVVDIIGERQSGVKGVVLKNLVTGKTMEKPIQGVFLAIGHTPNSESFRGQIETDKLGYIMTKNGTTATNIPGVFACGDVVDHRYRQAVTAAGTGCMAALDCEKYLEGLH